MKKLWAYLDGKKSKIALAYWTIVIPSLPVLYPAGVPDTMEKIVTVIVHDSSCRPNICLTCTEGVRLKRLLATLFQLTARPRFALKSSKWQ